MLIADVTSVDLVSSLVITLAIVGLLIGLGKFVAWMAGEDDDE